MNGATGATGATGPQDPELYAWKATISQEFDNIKITVSTVTTTDLPALQRQVRAQGLSITALQKVTTSHGTALSNLQQQALQLQQTLSQHGETLSSHGESINELVTGQKDHGTRLSSAEQSLRDALQNIKTQIGRASCRERV